MLSVRSAVAPGVPAYLVTRPSVGARDVIRRSLQDQVSDALGEHRVCVVIAPAGHGKTNLLSAWARVAERPVAWLSLTAADRHSDHLARGLSTVLAELEAVTDGAAVVVIDDIHAVGEDAARRVLRPFIDNPPQNVRLILAGRGDPGLGLARLLASGELALVGTDALSFTAEEISEVARARGVDLTTEQAGGLHQLTRGWPVAVRLALLARSSASEAGLPIASVLNQNVPQLPEYLLETVFAELPDELSGFVVEACVSDWLTSSLADDVLGRQDGAARLEQALAAGLPVERREHAGMEPVYRWHPLMSASGRAILRRRDPHRLDELYVRAARALAPHDPVQAAHHALAGRDPELASALVRSHWLAAVLRGDSPLMEEVCNQLPAPYSDAPEILAIRAACLRNMGEVTRANGLDRRARQRTTSSSEPRTLDLTLALARLFVIDPEDELAAESIKAQRLLAELSDATGPLLACALLLLGWTEMRLKHAWVAVDLLREAGASCRAEGLTDLAERARVNEAFALAFSGHFDEARQLMSAPTREAAAVSWHRTDGAVEWFSTGWTQFWTGDAQAATDSLQRAADRDAGLTSFATVARCWLPIAAVGTRDRHRVERAAAWLDLAPDGVVQGVGFGAVKAVARAGAALLEGRHQAAAALLDEAIAVDPGHAGVSSLCVELYWQCGKVDQALALAALVPPELPAYLTAGPVVVTALAARRRGDDDEAHRLLETALAASAPQNLIRPFLLGDPDLTLLLAEHSAWGTGHQDLVASALARRSLLSDDPPVQPLTSRELEVLSHLSTTRSLPEIAAILYISRNTLKSHLKSIYRKLGVANRRDAVRAFHTSDPHHPAGVIFGKTRAQQAAAGLR
jgi:LuxR family maltose regulon positive regulatory protein